MQYTLPDDIASDMFLDSRREAVGTLYMTCYCGIMHYATRQRYDVTVNFPLESDKVKHHDDADYIISYEIDNKFFVMGCRTCDSYQKKYENFIWEHRDLIQNYLKIRSDQEKKWTEQEKLKKMLSNCV